MRLVINQQFKDLVRDNYSKIIKIHPSLKWSLKNILYKNQSADINIIKKICKILGISKETLNLELASFRFEKNLGKFAICPKIKFIGSKENLAEFIGIMLGDGNLWKNSIRINIDKREVEFKMHIKKIFTQLFGLKLQEILTKNSNQLRLQKTNKNLTKFLIRQGLKKGNKTKNQVRIPKWIRKKLLYKKKCIRGLIDTDGSIVISKRDKKRYINFSNRSLSLLVDVKACCREMGLDFVKGGEHSITLYRQDEIKKFFEIIGFSNQKHIHKFKNVSF